MLTIGIIMMSSNTLMTTRVIMMMKMRGYSQIPYLATVLASFRISNPRNSSFSSAKRRRRVR